MVSITIGGHLSGSTALLIYTLLIYSLAATPALSS